MFFQFYLYFIQFVQLYFSPTLWRCIKISVTKLNFHGEFIKYSSVRTKPTYDFITFCNVRIAPHWIEYYVSEHNYHYYFPCGNNIISLSQNCSSAYTMFVPQCIDGRVLPIRCAVEPWIMHSVATTLIIIRIVVTCKILIVQAFS